jgi:Na+/proline symporter
MHLHPVDLAIIAAYVVATIGIGFWISKRASKSIQNYFLGGNEIPWYMLGLSNASGMFDISGTMWMVYLLFVYGLKSVWIPWLWPVFNQIFLMVYLSIWLRRSGVMTGAEWIKFRFGETRGANLAHIIVVVFALFNVIGFLAYGFIGIGKFAATFLPWELSSDPTTNTNLYGLIITAITTLYVVKGGMFSVVFTEVLQFGIMTVACIWVGIIAMEAVSPEMLDAAIPAGWRELFFGWTLNLDWSGIMDAANTKIQEDGWELFSIFFMLMLFKGYLQSAAGPAPNYDMQRVLSAKTPREAAKMSGFVSLVLLVPRYMLITGLTVLALVFFSDELNSMGAAVDFELVLPFAMREFIPVGLLGLLIAARQDLRVDELHRLGRRRHHRDRNRLLRDVAERHRAVDRGGAVRRLHRIQPTEVVLVAIQCLRLLLGNGWRNPGRDGGAGAPAPAHRTVHIPDHSPGLDDRLHCRELHDRAR